MEMASYPEGTPCIVDLQTPDPAAVTPFYTALFGWEIAHFPDVEHGPSLMTLRGRHVATIAPIPPGIEQPSLPLWNTYLAVDDADRVAALVEPSGGTLVAEPFDALDKGRIAVIKDPSGGQVSLWQAGTVHGAQLVNEPGALCWNELATR